MSLRVTAPSAGILSGILHFECARLLNTPTFSEVQFIFLSQIRLPYTVRTNIINENKKYFTTSAFSIQFGKLLSFFLNYLMLASANPVQRSRIPAETPDAEHCPS